VGDVDCGDSLVTVLKVAEIFQQALPGNAVMLVSGGLTKFIVVTVVPEQVTEKLTATEWADAGLSVVAGAKSEGTSTLASGVADANPDKGIFPLKLKDQCRGPTFILLRRKKLVKEEDDEDDMVFFDE